MIDVEQDITIEENLVVSVLQQYANQRFTVNRSSALNILSLTINSYTLNLNDTSLVHLSTIIVSVIGSYPRIPVTIPVVKCSITRIVSLVSAVIVVNELELIVQAECGFLTILPATYLVNILEVVVVSNSLLLLLQVLLHEVNTEILGQVNLIANPKLKSSTTGIVQSLLRRVPNVDTICSTIEVVNLASTFLVTILVSRTIAIARHVRLLILRLIVPNQTFELYASRNEQSIVRSNDTLLTIVQLKSYSIVCIIVVCVIL